MSDMDTERSAEARRRAERALVMLLHEVGDDVQLIVLGGLVPEVLARGDGVEVPEHLGTTDVDVLLITRVRADSSLKAVEHALVAMEFTPHGESWRWRGLVDGQAVKIEFLCDLEEYREGEVVRPSGCAELAAVNLRGTGYVARDWAWEELTAQLADGTTVTVRARFAGLEGYLLSKCVAVRSRGAEKDYYDFAYVVLHNRAGGPEVAARRLRSGALADAIPALRSTLLEVRERYRRPRDIGPASYASQALLVDPGGDEALLRADAVDAVDRFFSELNPDHG
jgi:hypothetical protein